MYESDAELIPNIDFAREFHLGDGDIDVHYDALGVLANHFGFDMPVHWHDRVYQLHYLESGEVQLSLEGVEWLGKGPALFLTPPATPHAFTFSRNCIGHVLSVKQEVLWQTFDGEAGGALRARVDAPLAMQLDAGSEAHRTLGTLLTLCRDEWQRADVGRERNLRAYSRLIFARLAAMRDSTVDVSTTKRSAVQLFQRFNQLVEQRFRYHDTLASYADALGTSEFRLNHVCRRVAALPASRILMDRVVQEARRLLWYSTAPVSEVAFQLGFADAPYFTRFFKRETGMTPSQFRARATASKSSAETG